MKMPPRWPTSATDVSQLAALTGGELEGFLCKYGTIESRECDCECESGKYLCVFHVAILSRFCLDFLNYIAFEFAVGPAFLVNSLALSGSQAMDNLAARRASPSIHLRAGGFHHGRPFRDFGLDIGREFRR